MASLGATYLGDNRCRFLVWAPRAQRVELHVVSPQERVVPLGKKADGYHEAAVDGVAPGCRYLYRLGGEKERPDPASRYQPEGVHGPSEVVDNQFPWRDGGWRGLPLQEYLTYELHVGAFSGEGTFDGVIPHLAGLREMGITAVELMPVAQFPGDRNWGYDGVYPYAVQDSYGGPGGLKRLVNACHGMGLAVILDVVYNHLGPEGNYCADFGPYFTERYRTPWGAALNFDGAGSDEVRRFFIENALYWLTEFHIDALRLDALHAILDISAYHFLEELSISFHWGVEKLNRRAYLIGESVANDARLIRPRALGGYGLDALWNDDFHHALHTLLTGEQGGYYEDFGSVEQLAKAFREGFVYSGEFSPYRQRRHGTSSRDAPAHRFVVFSQDHDQVGNRARGDRLSTQVSFDALKLAAGVVLLSPFLPLLFMGEEYGETAPFPYFVSHSDPRLIEAVRKGRREEFAAFGWQGELPDPQDEATFHSAKLNRRLQEEGQHRILSAFYRELIRMRKEIPALARLSKDDMEVRTVPPQKLLLVLRRAGDNHVLTIFNFNQKQVKIDLPVPRGRWRKLLDSADGPWQGEGSEIPPEVTSDGKARFKMHPSAFVVLLKES